MKKLEKFVLLHNLDATNGNIYATYDSTQASEYWNKTLLKMLAMDKFEHCDLAERKMPIPKGKDKTIKYGELLKLSSPLNELLDDFNTPDPIVGSDRQITFDIKNYGAWMGFNDHLSALHQFNVMKDYVKEIYRIAKEQRDNLCKEGMYTGASKIFLNGTDAGAADIDTTTAPLTISPLRKIRLQMMYNTSADGTRSPIKGHKKAGGGNKYLVVLGEQGQQDIMEDPEFKAQITSAITNSYYLENKIPTLFGLTFNLIENEYIQTNSSGVEVHTAFVLGREAFATSNLDGKSIELIIKKSDSSSMSDPLTRIKMTVGFKFWFGMGILRQEAIYAVQFVPTFA